MKRHVSVIWIALALAQSVGAQVEHHHPAPEHLGTAHFEVSCTPAVTVAFDRAVALLHGLRSEPTLWRNVCFRGAMRTSGTTDFGA